MGLLNSWLQKKDKDQLKDAGEKKTRSIKVAKEIVKKSAPESATKTKHVNRAKTEDKAVPTKNKLTLSENSTAYKVLVRPLVTEKSAVAESGNKYSFVVSNTANKNQVKQAVAEVYGVKPAKINIMNIDGRVVRFGRGMGRRSDYKKAIVTLPAGSAIDIHAGV